MWPEERRTSTPEEREAYRQAHPQETGPDFAISVKGRSPTAKRLMAGALSLVGLVGGGWAAKESGVMAEPSRLSALETRVSTLESGQWRIESRVLTLTVVLLNRDKWAARQAGDGAEVQRIQQQIDELEREQRVGAR